MASYAEKVIDFDVTAEHELDPRLAKEMSMLPGHAQKKEKAKQVGRKEGNRGDSF